jgi:hypothetical protein
MTYRGVGAIEDPSSHVVSSHVAVALFDIWDLDDLALCGARLGQSEALLPQSRRRRHFKVSYSDHCRSPDSVINMPYQGIGYVFQHRQDLRNGINVQ